MTAQNNRQRGLTAQNNGQHGLTTQNNGQHGLTAQKNRQHGLMDYVKFLMSLYVVMFHCSVWAEREESLLVDIIHLYEEITIPLFFVMSGYFLLHGIRPEERERADRRLTANVHGTLKMYLFWCALYLPYAFWGNLVVCGNSLLKATVKVVWGVAVVGSNYNSWQMWYMLALVVSAWMIRFGLRRGLTLGQITAIGAVLCVLGLYLNAVEAGGSQFPAVRWAADWYFRLFYDIRNGPLSGLFYVAAGLLLACRPGMPPAAFWVGAVLSCGIALAVQDQFLVHGLAVMGAVMCIFGVIESIDMPVTLLSRRLREISRYIYLSHMLFFGVADPLVKSGSRWAVFGLTITATLIFSVAATLRMERKAARAAA